MPAKQRLDIALVARGLVESREKAQALIIAGEVFVNGQKALKPGHAISPEVQVQVKQQLRYVSRAGLKLEAALASFGITVTNKVCLDVGTSTGGFTDCLLQHGASRVYCVDTGAGQIDWKLRMDPRVILRENTNARYLTSEIIPAPVEIVVCDVSFISVTMLIPVLAPFLAPGGDWVILVKPQFEVGRGNIGKGGIVRDPKLHEQACARVREAIESLGFRTELVDSPIAGMEGNREFLMHARRGVGPK